ncbi:MAG: site-specific integrase [Rikenellaceae bacterium]
MAISKVTLRRRAVKDNKISLYLDYYPPIRIPETMKESRRESLGIYIYKNPKNQMELNFNREMLDKAEAVRCMRQTSIINEEFGFFDKHKMKGDFLAYYKDMLIQKNAKWKFVYNHFYNFVGGKCSFGEITIDLCRKFGEYLLNAPQLRQGKKTMAQNSAAGYYATFRALLKIAYRDKRIKENVNEFLDGIKSESTQREHLTHEELMQLVATPCDIDVLKRASLFSCLTGLRISDILKLDWSEIVKAPDGGYNIRLRTQKSKKFATLPINFDALELCGERGEGLVFKGLKRHHTQKPLKKWLASAGIDKRFSFHCFRHSFAVLQIAFGSDIYTVSKMMTHSNVATTQIYADLVSSKKRESANRITINTDQNTKI